MIKYVTKYALSVGILTLEGEACNDGAYFTGTSPEGLKFFISSKHCFDTYQCAVDDANLKRIREIKSLNKRLKKLNELTF